MKINRRDFVAYGSGFLSSLIPFLNIYPAKARGGLFAETSDKNILVLIHLAGGNDWFNTIIPYQSSSYYCQRPSLAIFSREVLRLDNQFALHPALVEIEKLYEQNRVAVLLNVGHPQATLSHHKAIENWQYGIGNKVSNITWQGRYAKYIGKGSAAKLVFPAINIQPNCSRFDPAADQQRRECQDEIVLSSLNHNKKFEFELDMHYRINKHLNESNSRDVSISDMTVSSFADTAASLLSGNYYNEKNGFVSAMNLVANLIKQKTNANIYNISLGGFDTHSNQLSKHAFLLKMLSKGIMSFQSDLEKNGLADKVLTIICSEFGRTLKENDNFGTDHGYVNHVLAIGNSIKGGIYGNKYLADLHEANKYNFDYRSLHSTILNKWLSCPSETILGQKFETMSFI